MFQYALARRIAMQTGQDVSFDSRFLSHAATKRALGLTAFQLEYREASPTELNQLALGEFKPGILGALSRIMGRVTTDVVVEERPFTFSDGLIRSECAYYIGHWQAIGYLSGLRAELTEAFVPSLPLPPSGQKLLKQTLDTNTVCLHVRRGDFASNPKIKKVHGLKDLDYYLTGYQLMRDAFEFERALVFTDDPEWCEQNFGNQRDFHIVDHRTIGMSAAHSLYLMRHCTAFVIPNSTFSWWAAWLSQGGHAKVVAPAEWLGKPEHDAKDLIPDNWIKI